MAISNITENDILKALLYIDENGVPNKNKSMQYDLLWDDGKRYPTKYVITVAEHIANGTEHFNRSF